MQMQIKQLYVKIIKFKVYIPEVFYATFLILFSTKTSGDMTSVELTFHFLGQMKSSKVTLLICTENLKCSVHLRHFNLYFNFKKCANNNICENFEIDMEISFRFHIIVQQIVNSNLSVVSFRFYLFWKVYENIISSWTLRYITKTLNNIGIHVISSIENYKYIFLL